LGVDWNAIYKLNCDHSQGQHIDALRQDRHGDEDRIQESKIRQTAEIAARFPRRP
jgi:hypothetical protein